MIWMSSHMFKAITRNQTENVILTTFEDRLNLVFDQDQERNNQFIEPVIKQTVNIFMTEKIEKQTKNNNKE